MLGRRSGITTSFDSGIWSVMKILLGRSATRKRYTWSRSSAGRSRKYPKPSQWQREYWLLGMLDWRRSRCCESKRKGEVRRLQQIGLWLLGRTCAVEYALSSMRCLKCAYFALPDTWAIRALQCKRTLVAEKHHGDSSVVSGETIE